MFIHSVETPRKIRVDFGIPNLGRKNQISLLTGPNGSGKTEVLASIAHVFHGNRRQLYGAAVHWSRGTQFQLSHIPLSKGDEYADYPQVRLIAQTFSPFSRFPLRQPSLPEFVTPIYSRGERSAEQYTCVGFNQRSRVELSKLAFSIVEKGVLRLSERPKTAKVAFDVLEDLGFKHGIRIIYRAKKYLAVIAAIARDSTHLESELRDFERTGELRIASNNGKGILPRLRREISSGGAEEVSEYLRHALNMIEEYSTKKEWVGKQRLEVFEFSAFRDRRSMSSDFPYLQAFSVLARLELIEVIGCELTPLEGRPINLRSTSSGQQQMLCSNFGLAAALDDHSIVLIDEPELSLHPRWQMNYFKHLETALEEVRDCHVILATHSPLIAQAAAAHGVQIVSMGDDSTIRNSKASTRRQGSSVEEMLVEVFDTPIPNSLHISKEIFSLVTKAEAGTRDDQKEAMDQLHKYIRLYRRQGEGSSEMTNLLNKAVNLVSNATPRK